MENEKLRETLNDLTEDGVSDCCGASVVLDICMDCKEHCGIADDEDDDKLGQINGVDSDEYRDNEENR